MTNANRVAIVTGASSGIGRSIAHELGRSGWAVALVARRRSRLEALADEIRSAGGAALVCSGDIRDTSFATRAMSEVVARFGHLDLLVNNAGAPTSRAENATDAEFDAAFALNVRAMYRLSHLALPHLQETKGSIVNISSAGVARVIPIDLVYLTSKGAVETMTRGMAKKWGRLGVRVNAIAPGILPTEIFEVAGLSPEAAREETTKVARSMQALPRAGQTADVATAVAFLASSGGAFITGATLHVDGGMALGG